MSKSKLILIYIGLFLLGLVVGIVSEDGYRQMIRLLYCSLTNNKITFDVPKIDFFFFTVPFIFSMACYFILVFYLLRRQIVRSRIVNGALILLLFPGSILQSCYFGGVMMLAVCTACNDGTRVLTYDDVAYTSILIEALVLSLLPAFITDLRMRRKSAKAAK